MQFINRACMISLLCTINDSYAMLYLYMIHHYRQMQLSLAVYIYIYNSVRLFVCLFVRDSGKTYCTERHQTLRDYKVRLRECAPQVEIARIAVLEEISFYFRFFVRLTAILLIIAPMTSGCRTI